MARHPLPTVRRARLADIEVLVAHRRGMWEAIGDFTKSEIAAADPVYRRWMRRMWRQHRYFAWIVDDAEGRPVGSGAIWLSEAQPRPRDSPRFRPYILSMYTEPGHRGEGIASAIVRAAVDFARGRGYRRVTLHASVMGRSVYRRLGFERGWEMRLALDAPARRRRAR
jgi:GNAT superfamily N-acetyltransferase